MSESVIDWDGLRQRHPPALVHALERSFSEQGPFQISAEILVSETNCRTEQAEQLLRDLCPPLSMESLYRCPNCHSALTDVEAASELCPECRQQFVEHGGVQVSQLFVYRALRSRDVAWVLALHGMNTRGAWQESFNWRVSTAYARSVPVAIYKYGLVRPGAIWLPSLRRKVKGVVTKIHDLRGETEQNGFMGPPDVIAHSLGTWLIGHALRWNPSLSVGRVILTGSILRPDFDWAELIARGQVDAVLNHYGTKDFWARIAHYGIPDSGPSGCRGFNSTVPVVQVRADGFRHSDFFMAENLPTVFESVWRPFLAQPKEQQASTANTSTQWRPAPWILRATVVPFVILICYWTILAALICCTLLGLYEALRWL